MSIRVMTLIWDSELYKGGTLLVLLAMADFANDQGGSIFPTIATLAKKARLSDRQVTAAIKEMRQDGVLEIVKHATGRPGQATQYRIVLERVKKLHPSGTGEVSSLDGCNPQHGGVKSEAGGVKNPAPHIDNHQEPPKEPSVTASGAAGGQADLLQEVAPPPPPILTPAQTLAAAYDAYGEAAARAGWPAVQMRTPTRDKHLKARLDDAGGLEGWKVAMAKAEASDFCCGRAPPRPGKPPFFADFDFLTQQSSFVKLMEGKYDDRQGSKPAAHSGNIGIAARVAARRAAERDHRHKPG